jgi:hypothetical protein
LYASGWEQKRQATRGEDGRQRTCRKERDKGRMLSRDGATSERVEGAIKADSQSYRRGGNRIIKGWVERKNDGMKQEREREREGLIVNGHSTEYFWSRSPLILLH